jgi:molybdopterin synthase sulfur carrier subunit
MRLHFVTHEKFGILSHNTKGEKLMKVSFYANLRAIVGQKTIEAKIDLPASARDLVEVIVNDYPALRNELLDANNEFYGHMKFFINGRDTVYLENYMSTIIQPDDNIDIFPPVGGG